MTLFSPQTETHPTSLTHVDHITWATFASTSTRFIMGLIPFSHGLVSCGDTRSTLDHSATPLKKVAEERAVMKPLENQNDQPRMLI